MLEQKDEGNLKEIKANYPNDVSQCCTEMFQLWLRKTSKPTWDQLIHALKEVELNRIADKIEGMLMVTEVTVDIGAGMLSRSMLANDIILLHGYNYHM